jgi:putative glutamine amidotransferase
MTLIVGIPACTVLIRQSVQHAAPSRYGEALMIGSGAIPVLLPPVGEGMLAVLDRLDGLLLDGSPSNVMPSLYGATEDLTPDRHDPARDATTLPLVRAALARGMPVLAICRGVQELNVAMGGSLHQQVQELPGRQDHRAGPGTQDERYAFKHEVRLCGEFATLLKCRNISVNSLHEQALDRLAPGLLVEGVAEDGTIEVVRVAEARSFAFGVQFHPEWHVRDDAPSRAIFTAFGAACAEYAAMKQRDE